MEGILFGVLADDDIWVFEATDTSHGAKVLFLALLSYFSPEKLPVPATHMIKRSVFLHEEDDVLDVRQRVGSGRGSLGTVGGCQDGHGGHGGKTEDHVMRLGGGMRKVMSCRRGSLKEAERVVAPVMPI